MRRQCPRQVAMADKNNRRFKCCIAKYMIRMAVGIYDVSDRLVGDSTHGCEQTTAFAHTAAAVNHRHTIVADHKADVSDRALVFRAHERVRTEVNVHARGHFTDRKRLDRLLRIGRRCCTANREAHDRQRHERTFQITAAEPIIHEGAFHRIAEPDRITIAQRGLRAYYFFRFPASRTPAV